MERVTVTQPSRVQTSTVIIDHRCPIDDLVTAILIHVGYGQIVVSLPAISAVSWRAVIAVERPNLRQFALPPVPRRKDRAGVVTTAHHQARSNSIQICNAGQEPRSK